jgi:predicted Holliday junction resolvase-like endonuclease
MSTAHGLSSIVRFFETQRNIFGICPHCQTLFRLSELKISYRRRFAKDWYDRLLEQQEKIEDEQATIRDTLDEIREKAVERTRKRLLPQMLMQADPIFTPLGYYPQDVKAIFDPIDFAIFDGMNREEIVRRVVFMDERTTDERIREIQSSMERAIQRGKYGFQSVRLTKTGQFQQ